MAFATDSKKPSFFLPMIDSGSLQFYIGRFLSLGIILVVFLIWSLPTYLVGGLVHHCMYPRQELLPTVTDKKRPTRQAPWPRFQLPSSLTLPLFFFLSVCNSSVLFIVAISMSDHEIDHPPSFFVTARQHGKRWSERGERGGAIYLERHLETRRCHCEEVCFAGVY